MSIQARQALVNSGHLFADLGQWPHAFSDLLDPTITQTWLIEGLQYLVGKGYHIQLTAVRTDHTTVDGAHGHNPGGNDADMWPLTGPTLNAWLSENDAVFQTFLSDMAHWVGTTGRTWQLGLAGAARTDANFAAAAAPGVYTFSDGDQDHVHFGPSPVGGW
jgi:hypothetical protein